MQQKISNVRGYGIPLDTAVVDIDYMDRYKDFTVGQQVGWERGLRLAGDV